MNFAVSRVGLRLTSVSNVRNFSHCLKGHLFNFSSSNHNAVIIRKKSTKANLYDKRKHWYEPEEQTIGAYGWFLLSIPLFAFGLGCWQVERRKWKLDLIQKLETQLNSPPVNLPLELEELQTMEYRPIKVKGRFLHDREFLVGPRSLIINGAPASGDGGGGLISQGNVRTGYMVITPFKLEGRPEIILINRGWVPLNKRNPERRKNDRVEGVVEVTGIIRLNETRPQFVPRNKPMEGIWYYRDLNAMAEFMDTEPVYMDLITDLGTEDGPIPGQTRVSMRNEHTSYIFTWFTLSLITGWMWHRMFIRKLPLL